MPLYFFYTMVQKSQKWPKTQIKGGGPALTRLMLYGVWRPFDRLIFPASNMLRVAFLRAFFFLRTLGQFLDQPGQWALHDWMAILSLPPVRFLAHPLLWDVCFPRNAKVSRLWSLRRFDSTDTHLPILPGIVGILSQVLGRSCFSPAAELFLVLMTFWDISLLDKVTLVVELL